NLYARRDGTATPVAPRDAEFAGPLWGLGQSNYVVIEGGRIVARYGEAERDHLVVVEPGSGSVREIGLPFGVLGALQRLDDRTVALLAGSADETGAVVTVDVETGEAAVVRRPSPAAVEARYISRAQAITFPGAGGL